MQSNHMNMNSQNECMKAIHNTDAQKLHVIRLHKHITWKLKRHGRQNSYNYSLKYTSSSIISGSWWSCLSSIYTHVLHDNVNSQMWYENNDGRGIRIFIVHKEANFDLWDQSIHVSLIYVSFLRRDIHTLKHKVFMC